MVSRYNVIYDNAHNEYLQYLVTTGILRLASYIGILASAFTAFIKRGKDNCCIKAICIAVAAYATQAVVNLNVPVTFPIMWTLLSMGIASCRNSRAK